MSEFSEAVGRQRAFGYIAQWLGRLISDQHISGSIPAITSILDNRSSRKWICVRSRRSNRVILVQSEKVEAFSPSICFLRVSPAVHLHIARAKLTLLPGERGRSGKM